MDPNIPFTDQGNSFASESIYTEAVSQMASQEFSQDSESYTSSAIGSSFDVDTVDGGEEMAPTYAHSRTTNLLLTSPDDSLVTSTESSGLVQVARVEEEKQLGACFINYHQIRLERELTC